MKRMKSVNGFTIYQTTKNDVIKGDANYSGEYRIYISSDIRNYGVQYSYPEFEDIDSYVVAVQMAETFFDGMSKKEVKEYKEFTGFND